MFRYRARLWPDTLSEADAERWQALRAARLLEGEGGVMTLERLFQRIDELAEAASEREDARAETILGALYDYADAIAP